MSDPEYSAVVEGHRIEHATVLSEATDRAAAVRFHRALGQADAERLP
jgi:hypothetical protein